jgi:hypothetical protein
MQHQQQRPTCCLCASWPRVGDHGVHHARDEHRLAQQVAVADQLLLDQSHLLRSNVQANMAPACVESNTNTVKKFADKGANRFIEGADSFSRAC